jgi:diaminohydroxyphosphoribosylaminopyrimidine deaminase/5-amino-6-(5-phosphoribosylamino)uracil reductase
MTDAPPAPAALAPLQASPADRPFVVAQLGQSLDGRIATETGESKWINKACALRHVHALRAHVDAVVVGAGTVTADDPQLNVRLVKGRAPARVMIDPSGRLRPDARCLAKDGARVIVVRAETGPLPKLPDHVTFVTIPRVKGDIPPPAIVSALFDLGLRRLLIEGGAVTVSGFIAAGAVDRLHVLVAPMIIGSGKTGLALPPVARLDDSLRPRTDVHVLDDGDVLFDCDLRSSNR